MKIDDFGKVTVTKKDDPRQIQKFYEDELGRREVIHQSWIALAREEAVLAYDKKIFSGFRDLAPLTHKQTVAEIAGRRRQALRECGITEVK